MFRDASILLATSLFGAIFGQGCGYAAAIDSLKDCHVAMECGDQIQYICDGGTRWVFEDGPQFHDGVEAVEYCWALEEAAEDTGAEPEPGCIAAGGACAGGRNMSVCADGTDVTWKFQGGASFTDPEMAQAYCDGCNLVETDSCLDDAQVLECDSHAITETGTFEKTREALYACAGYTDCELRVACPSNGRLTDRCLDEGTPVYFDPSKPDGERLIGGEDEYPYWCDGGICFGKEHCTWLPQGTCLANSGCGWMPG